MNIPIESDSIPIFWQVSSLKETHFPSDLPISGIAKRLCLLHEVSDRSIVVMFHLSAFGETTAFPA